MAPSDWQKEAIRCQTEWSKILQSWKYFENEDDLVKTYLGICLFGFVESEEIAASSLRTYHSNYNESQRAHIEKIFAHLVSLSDHKIELGHTFLYLNENGIVYCVFRFRIKDRIFFIEPSGRFYNSWVHFLDTNKLPACKFFAPENGVYRKSGKIVCYQTTGSKSMFSKTQTIMDWVCAAAGIGCTLLGVFSIAPGVVASAAIAVGAKNMHKTISNFLDQEEHRQLNTMGSLNGAISLAAIAISALPGASKTCEMISLAGEHGLISLKILQSLNFTNRLIDAGYFGTYLLHLSYISQKGKISTVDALELAAQMFILYGAVVNVEHLRNAINREKKITKYDLSCKFNDWKNKLSKSGVRVKDCLPLTGLKLLASRCQNPLKIILKFYSKEELILNTCYDCEHFTIDYLCEKISLNQFCLEMRSLFVNFSFLFDGYYEEFGDIVRYYVTPIVQDTVSSNDYKDICKLITYAILKIKKIDPHNEFLLSEKVIVNQPACTLCESAETTENYKVIVDVAKCLVNKKNVFSSIDQVVKSCLDSIQFTTTKLTEIITDAHKSIVEFNRGVVGEDRLKVILERVHATTVDEFFYHREAFRNLANKLKTETESLPGNEFVPLNPSRLPNNQIEEISERVMQLYELAYASITESKKLTLQDTMKTLQNVAEHWTEKLITEMNTCRPPASSSSTLYSELNAQLAVMSVSGPINLDTFRKIFKALECQASTVVSSFQSSSLEDFVIVTNDRKFERNDSQLCEALVAITCNFFTNSADALNGDDDLSRIHLLRKVFHFVVTKFLKLFTDDEACERISKKHDNGSNSVFSLYPKSRFYSVIQEFNDVNFLNELTSEFQNCSFDDEWFYNNIDFWGDIIDSDQFRLRIIRCEKIDDEEFYRTVASKLFDIKVDKEYDVTINVNSVFLQSLRKFIIFNFVNDCDVFVSSLNLTLNI